MERKNKNKSRFGEAKGLRQWYKKTSTLTLSLAVLLAAQQAQATVLNTSRVSVDSSGFEANGFSHGGDVSDDGEFIVFTSQANNLSPVPTNGHDQVYLHQRSTGTTELISQSSAGVAANGMTSWPSISGDGRFVVYSSSADNLVAGDIDGYEDIFVYDRQTGVTERIDIGSPSLPAPLLLETSISGDGRYIAFISGASDLVPNDNNGMDDIFLYDRDNSSLSRINQGYLGQEANGMSHEPKLSADGRFVAFVSMADNLVANDTNGNLDVFVYEIATSNIERVSVSGSGLQASGGSFSPYISADGRYVGFSSSANDLVAGDSNGFDDIFIRDRQLGTTERVNLHSNGSESNGFSHSPTISAGGRYVSFLSMANNLVDNDTNGFDDVFVRDRENGVTERVNLGLNGLESTAFSHSPRMSANALYVIYTSDSANLVNGDNNGFSDVFIAELDNVEAFTRGVRITPSSPAVDPLIDPNFSVDVEVSASGLYGLQISCQSDSSLATLNAASYGDLFDPASRLEIPAQINTPSLGDWQGSLSLMNPAEPISGSGIFASLDFSAQVVATDVLQINCSATASDKDGNPINLDISNAEVLIDDGIHVPNGRMLSGNITLPNGSDHSNILVTIEINGRSISTYTDSAGNYSFDSLRDGYYIVSFNSSLYVNSCNIARISDGNDTQMAAEVMLEGDINGDGLIDIADFSVLASLYGKTVADPEYTVLADLNRDDSINVFDLTLLGSHFGVNNCDPSTVTLPTPPTVFFNTAPVASFGSASLNSDKDVLTWDKPATNVIESASAVSTAGPQDSELFAVGVQMSGEQSSYLIELRNPVDGNHMTLHYSANVPTPTLHYSSYIYGVSNYESFPVPLLMDQMELGFDNGVVSFKLGSLSFTSAYNVGSLGGNVSDWQVEVRIEQDYNQSPAGVASARLITDAESGLTLPTSVWSLF